MFEWLTVLFGLWATILCVYWIVKRRAHRKMLRLWAMSPICTHSVADDQ